MMRSVTQKPVLQLPSWGGDFSSPPPPGFRPITGLSSKQGCGLGLGHLGPLGDGVPVLEPKAHSHMQSFTSTFPTPGSEHSIHVSVSLLISNIPSHKTRIPQTSQPHIPSGGTRAFFFFFFNTPAFPLMIEGVCYSLHAGKYSAFLFLGVGTHV